MNLLKITNFKLILKQTRYENVPQRNVRQRKQFKQTFNSKRNELPKKVRRRIHIYVL